MIHLHRLHFPSERNTVTRHRGAAAAAAVLDYHDKMNVDLASLASEPSRTRYNSLQNLVLTSRSGRVAALAMDAKSTLSTNAAATAAPR